MEKNIKDAPSVSPDEIWKILHRLSQSQEETDRRMQETDRRMQETDRRMQATDQRINKIVGDWGNSWGNLAESLTTAGLVKRFQEHGVNIERIIENMHTRDTEFDLIGVNGKEVIVVEVKARLRVEDVPRYVKKLRSFTTYCPEYRDKVILGAMASFKSNIHPEVVRTVSDAGLFFIDISGDVIIRNPKDFTPENFS